MDPLDGCEFLRFEGDCVVESFDCADVDLNDFIATDAVQYRDQLLAVTYVIKRGNSTLAFFSVSNDKVSREETISGKAFERFRAMFSGGKKLRSYPAVKIGRLAVDKDCQKSGIGTAMLDYVKVLFVDRNKTGCRYITVDAYCKSLQFYERNGFDYLTTADESSTTTRQMYFDLVKIRG
jgi:GNAT superfamily N-acetyltransferase